MPTSKRSSSFVALEPCVLHSQKLQLGRPKAFVEKAVAKAIAATASGPRGSTKVSSRGSAKGGAKGGGGLDFASFEGLMLELGGDKDTEAVWAALCSKNLNPAESALNPLALTCPTDPFDEFLRGSGDVNVYVAQTVPKKVTLIQIDNRK